MEEHLRTTGTNEHVLAGTPPCDAGLSEISAKRPCPHHTHSTHHQKKFLSTLIQVDYFV
jgi:hypothetical protein